ncbi:MAG TPA: hypothetical protein VGL55_11795 [Steroidobacteraceae bacterium]|jgi:opacity protein-like surface antigen
MGTKALTAIRVFLLAACAGPVLAQEIHTPPPAPPPAPPSGAPSGATFDAAEHLYIAPKNGQTQDQVWSDRYTCHNWARTQSGFDPTRPSPGATPSELTAQREQYRRALTACLESHGYGVSEAAAGSAGTNAAPPAAAPAATSRYEGSRYRLAPTRGFNYHPVTVAIDGGYTIVQGDARHAVDDGYNTGLSINWFPFKSLPLGLRINGSYMRFTENLASVFDVERQTGLNNLFGHQNLYGGDADLQFNLRMGPSVREYFFGGVGWYRQQTQFEQLSFVRGFACFFNCFRAFFPVATTVQESTTGWMHSWNAGMGFEFALNDPASFFVEARYMRLGPMSSKQAFVPITIGLRF